MYKKVDIKQNFPKQEEEILKFWKENDTFKKSIEQRNTNADFVLYDGPPFATGLPHFGHFIPSTIKDIIPRYMTMKGKRVERRFGWDCHGLPVENLIEKELGINSKHEIEDYGVANFNEKCRQSVLKYTKEWRSTISRMGRWVDFDNEYKTMDKSFMESVWWVFKALWNKNLVYEGKYILPYCPRCSTVLSTHELALGYKIKQDPAITIRFKITGKPLHFSDDEMNNGKTYFLAWTTTPWTLPSNLGLCMGEEIDYVKVKDKSSEDFYILAKSRLGAYYKNENEYEIAYEKKGKDFLGISYEPLFDYFSSLSKKAFRIFNADFVSTEDGTGIVHTAPAFGEEDYNVFKNTGIEINVSMDAECRFTKEIYDYEGRFVKDCDKDIIKRLKDEKKLIKHETIEHQYPHCWRCASPLIYRAIGSWFVKVSGMRDKLLKANDEIKWQPQHIKDGRFGKWLQGARDWAISRNRYWGTPIPIWKNEGGTEFICVGSVEELEELSGKKIEDLHKQYVDEITFASPKTGSIMKRIPEVFDCWFESGSMPYAQEHYPFENKEKFEKNFPADFISEGLDQTRGWFYTLTVLSASLFDKPAFKNCIVNGIALAEDGRKMSKSLHNYTDPIEAINMFGADAIRLFLVHSAVVRADEIRYSDEGVREVIKSIILPLWSSYSFFVQYANIDKIECTGHEFDSKLPEDATDRWLLSVSQTLIENVTKALDDYDLSAAVDPIIAFIEQINNWYIRRNRRRFWKSGTDSEKKEAYATLYFALRTLALVMCPFTPFLSESIWQNLKSKDDKESVHLMNFPTPNKKFINLQIEKETEYVQMAVSMARKMRNKLNIKNRQPLSKLILVTKDKNEKEILIKMKEAILEEVNVKEAEFHENEEDLVDYSAKANFKILGKELGKDVKKIAEIIENLPAKDISDIVNGKQVFITLGENKIALNSDNVIITRHEKENLKIANNGTLTVALDTNITEELRNEGYARDLIRGIQNLRKEKDFDLVDRIELNVSGSEELKKAFESFKDLILSETLSKTYVWQDNLTNATKIESEDKMWSVKIEKI